MRKLEANTDQKKKTVMPPVTNVRIPPNRSSRISAIGEGLVYWVTLSQSSKGRSVGDDDRVVKIKTMVVTRS